MTLENKALVIACACLTLTFYTLRPAESVQAKKVNKRPCATKK